MKNIYIFTGGTTTQIAPHFSLCSEAYGQVGDDLFDSFNKYNTDSFSSYRIYVIKTKMALGNNEQYGALARHFMKMGIRNINNIKTNQDISDIVDVLIRQEDTKCIVMACALCDYEPIKMGVSFSDDSLMDGDLVHDFRKDGVIEKRLHKAQGLTLKLKPAEKIINKIRKYRKDIFLISFKATAGDSFRKTYLKGLGNLKASSSNLVFANDIVNKHNMIVTPEEFPYNFESRRGEALDFLAKMSFSRMGCHFTRSKVLEDDLIPWQYGGIPNNLREVVNFCVDKGAYKSFRGATVGHFACRGKEDGTIYTSIRKSDFNYIDKNGLVQIKSINDTDVMAYGAKPSVGGQSQRIIFKEHPEKDCIVHFHCPMKKDHKHNIPKRSQWQNECGSHECGQNTSNGLEEVVPGIKAVMLENHGPNIVFSKNENPKKVIDFIQSNFSLSDKTGGSVEIETF